MSIKITRFNQLYRFLKEGIYDYPSGEQEPVLPYEIPGEEGGTGMTNIPSINYTQFLHMLEDNWEINPINGQREATLVYGEPGLGKSAIIKQFAKQKAAEMGRNFASADIKKSGSNRAYVDWNEASEDEQDEIIKHPEHYFIYLDIRPAQCDPSDFRGIPLTGSEGSRYIRLSPQDWLYLMSRKGSAGLLFLDEINQAPKSVLDALFGIVQDRKAGSLKFSKDWNICAAGNLGAKHGNTEINPGLTRRFNVAALRPDPDSWIKWASAHGIHQTIISFVEQDKGDRFYKSPVISGPFPCPDNYTRLSGSMHTIDQTYMRAKDNNTLDRLPDILSRIGRSAQGFCGSDWGLAFETYLRYGKQYQWATIAKDPRAAFNPVSKQTGQSEYASPDQIAAMTDNIVHEFNKYFNAKSKYTQDQKEEFSAELCSIFKEYNQDGQMALASKLNRDKIAVVQFYTIISNKSNSEPYKTAFDCIKAVSGIQKKYVPVGK